MILAVAGCRPNFVKLLPVLKHWRGLGGEYTLIDTGQHYDESMSGSFFEELGADRPNYAMQVGRSGYSRPERIGTVCSFVGRTATLMKRRPEACIVAGDVDSTLGGALGARLAGVPVVHVESGLRSRNWEMPEELNRYATDHISDLLLCTMPEAVANLEEEAALGRIAFVGNTMIDSLIDVRNHAAVEDSEVLREMRLSADDYCVCTFHRPSLVDDPRSYSELLEALGRISAMVTVVVVMHPRVYARERPRGNGELRFVDALTYSKFLALLANARFVVTDSGGVQEETTHLRVPCFTYRTETERRITVLLGTNRVVGVDPSALEIHVRQHLRGGTIGMHAPDWMGEIPKWDGLAGLRAAEAVLRFTESSRVVATA